MIAALDHRDAGAAIRRLAMPSALALLGDQLLGIVDTIVIGALGAAPLAALTGASAAFMVLAVGMYAWTTGVRIVGAQAIGAGESERFGMIARSAAVVPLAIALGAALVTIVVARPLLHAILPTSAPLDAAANYLVLRNLCLPIMVVSALLIVAWATAGDSRLGLRVLIAINVIHVPLVFVLALGVGTHHPFGVTGAGISSLIAEFTGLCYAVWATRRRPHYRIFSSWRVERALIRLTAWLSWPEFVFLVLQLLPDPVAIALLAPAGTEAVAAFRALALVNDATWSLPGSLGDAAEIIVGQRIGARDYDGAKAFTRDALRIALRVCGGVGLLVALLAWPLAALFTLNPGLATVAALPLALQVGLTLPLKGWAMTILAPVRAAGDTRFVMLMGIVMTAIAIGGIVLGTRVLHLGLFAVPLGWVCGWIFRGSVTVARLRNGDWERRRLSA